MILIFCRAGYAIKEGVYISACSLAVGYGIAASGKDKGMECLLWNLHSTLNQKTTENVVTSKFHLPFSMIWAFTSGAEFWCGFHVMLDDHTLESVYRLDNSLILGLRSGHRQTRPLDLP